MSEWNHCPACGHDLDTGYECNYCGLDWLAFAVPWWRRLYSYIKVRWLE